jgi:hypothetical protein
MISSSHNQLIHIPDIMNDHTSDLYRQQSVSMKENDRNLNFNEAPPTMNPACLVGNRWWKKVQETMVRPTATVVTPDDSRCGAITWASEPRKRFVRSLGAPAEKNPMPIIASRLAKLSDEGDH